MAQATLPLLIEPCDLTLPIDARTTRLVDLCSSEQYPATFQVPFTWPLRAPPLPPRARVHSRAWPSCRRCLPS